MNHVDRSLRSVLRHGTHENPCVDEEPQRSWRKWPCLANQKKCCGIGCSFMHGFWKGSRTSSLVWESWHSLKAMAFAGLLCQIVIFPHCYHDSETISTCCTDYWVCCAEFLPLSFGMSHAFILMIYSYADVTVLSYTQSSSQTIKATHNLFSHCSRTDAHLIIDTLKNPSSMGRRTSARYVP
jgi:hypothetical protein